MLLSQLPSQERGMLNHPGFFAAPPPSQDLSVGNDGQQISADPTKRAVVGCAFFQRGLCMRGNNCEYSHQAWAKPQPCKFYTMGTGCTRGANCRFAHVEQQTKLWRCDNESMGVLIGHGGASINAIRSESGATVRQYTNDDTNTTFIISGELNSVNKAVHLLDAQKSKSHRLKYNKRDRDDAHHQQEEQHQESKRRRSNNDRTVNAVAKIAQGKTARCTVCSKLFKTAHDMLNHFGAKHQYNAPPLQNPQPVPLPPPPPRILHPILPPPLSYPDHSDDDSSLGRNYNGYTDDQVQALLEQGVKPWDDDADQVLNVLYGHDDDY